MKKMSTKLEDYILKTDFDPVSWEFYKRQEACDWSAEEFSFFKEKEDYQKATPGVRHLLKKLLVFS